MSHHQIRDTDEAWDSGALGADPKFAAVYEGDIQSRIDETMAMQAISIRLPKPLVESFKLPAFGEWEGLDYPMAFATARRHFVGAGARPSSTRSGTA